MVEREFDEGWSPDPPTEPGWYWVFRKDRKAMPVEVIETVHEQKSNAGTSSAVIIFRRLEWRTLLGEPPLPLDTIRRWGPRLPDVEVPAWVDAQYCLEGVNAEILPIVAETTRSLSPEEFRAYLQARGYNSP